MEWMTDLPSKYSESREPALDTCAGTFTAAKACLLLPKPRRLVGCENNLAYF